MDNILITGATGFLGKNLIKKFISAGEGKIFAVVRKTRGGSVAERRNIFIKRVFPHKDQRMASKRLCFIPGDITKKDLGIAPGRLKRLESTVDTIYHTAAVTTLGQSLKDIRKVNVRGTENILRLGLNWHRNGMLTRINHISTAYIVGKSNRALSEDLVSLNREFNNTYERTKLEAEHLVDKYRKKGLPIDIYRPSIIIDSVPIDKYNTSDIFKLFYMSVKTIFGEILISRDATLNILPADIVTDAIYSLSTSGGKKNRVYNIVNPRAVKARDIIRVLCEDANVKEPKYVENDDIWRRGLSCVNRIIIDTFLPYVNQNPSFCVKKTVSDLKKNGVIIPRMDRKFLLELLGEYKNAGLI